MKICLPQSNAAERYGYFIYAVFDYFSNFHGAAH